LKRCEEIVRGEQVGDFHCPMGATFYDDEGCILCEMCNAKTE